MPSCAADSAGREGKAIVEAKCNQCHFLRRLTQMRWTHDNWEKKIAWMRERIHERPGTIDLTDQEAKTVVDYLAANFSDTTRKPTQWSLVENRAAGRRRPLYRRGFCGTQSRRGTSRHRVDSQGVAWVNQLNVYSLENSIRRRMNIPRFLRRRRH